MSKNRTIIKFTISKTDNGLQEYLTQKETQSTSDKVGQKNSIYSMIQNFILKHKYEYRYVDMQFIQQVNEPKSLWWLMSVWRTMAALFPNLTGIFYSEQFALKVHLLQK